jgi:hypothetical protein
MAIYGVDYYGTAYYGASSQTPFSAAPFLATPYDYLSIQLSWSTPSGDWDYIRAVRNSYGFAVTADDGVVLFEDEKDVSRIYFNDDGTYVGAKGLKPSSPYYYSLFVRKTFDNTWEKAGDVIGIAVKDYGTNTSMFNYLPTILTSQIPHGTALDETNTLLFRFLKLFSLNYDLYRSQTDNIINRYDIENINGSLIPIFMSQFGLKYEPELGLKQSRIFLNNIVRLYQNKGSLLGLKEYIKAYAGYDNSIALSKNLMLDINDSSFEGSIGSWSSVSNCALELHSLTDTPRIAPYFEIESDANFPNLQTGTLQITGSASGTAELSLSGESPINYGIPVKAGVNYTFSGYARAATTARSVSAKLYWYNKRGVLISSSSSGTGVSDTSGTWNRFKVSQMSPSNAYFCVPRISIANIVNEEKHYVDALQFEVGSSATYFEEARKIKITLIASRINELLNPNFEGNTNNWTVSNGTIAQYSGEVGPDPDAASVDISGGSAQISPSTAAEVKLTSNSMPIFSGNDYAFSIYFYEVDESRAVTPFISWFDSSNTLISTSNGDSVSTSNVWTRATIIDNSPSNAAYAKAGIKWTASSGLKKIYVDAALFEKSSFINPYFDGSNGVAQKADLFWEGDSRNNARSHYYKNRFSVQTRLVNTLPNWINVGTTFELLLAQPTL